MYSRHIFNSNTKVNVYLGIFLYKKNLIHTLQARGQRDHRLPRLVTLSQGVQAPVRGYRTRPSPGRQVETFAYPHQRRPLGTYPGGLTKSAVHWRVTVVHLWGGPIGVSGANGRVCYLLFSPLHNPNNFSPPRRLNAHCMLGVGMDTYNVVTVFIRHIIHWFLDYFDILIFYQIWSIFNSNSQLFFI